MPLPWKKNSANAHEETAKTHCKSREIANSDEILFFESNKLLLYSVFQGFCKAKSENGGSILSSSQFLILPQLPQKIKLASKVVKVDSKIIISLPKI
jgi:hypothetical protein